jgi:tetratricopeptide (TPR) repeat protein
MRVFTAPRGFATIGVLALSLALRPASAKDDKDPAVEKAAAARPRATASPPAPPAASQAPAAAAPEDGHAGDAERAKQLYAFGAEAFAAQRNADAIRYFRRAAELVPSAKLTYNIGLAYEEMGDAGRALAEYRAYLKQEPHGERHEEVVGRVSSLERRLAETGVQLLMVTSDPPGATLNIGGRPVGVTPWAGELPPGHHAIELELAGHDAGHADVTLAADHSTQVALTLAPRAQDVVTAPSAGPRVSPLTWTFLGVGAGALTGGIAFELSRASSSADAERADDPVAAAEARGAADAKQMASVLLLGFGGAFVIGGGVLLALDLADDGPSHGQTARETDRATAPTATLRVPCGHQFCGVLAHGHF